MAASRTKIQTARDLPLSTAELVMLTYQAIQDSCSACGARATIHPPGIDPYARATQRLMYFVCRLARYMPMRRIPQIAPISPATAGRWDRAVLRRHLPEPKLDGLRILLIDEKAVRKRNGYVTLVMNGENGEGCGRLTVAESAGFARLSPPTGRPGGEISSPAPEGTPVPPVLHCTPNP